MSTREVSTEEVNEIVALIRNALYPSKDARALILALTWITAEVVLTYPHSDMTDEDFVERVAQILRSAIKTMREKADQGTPGPN